MWGVRGRALSHPRLSALWAGCRGPLPTGCGCGGARAWGPVTNPTARALASWLCALWGRHVGARGGLLLPGCGASWVGRSPSADCPPFRRATGLLCVCVHCLAGSSGPASWAPFGAPHLSFGLSSFAICLFDPLRACVALFVVFVRFFFFFRFSSSPPRCAPVVSCFACFPAPGALGPGILPPPAPPLSPPPPPLCAPLSPALRVFRPGVPWALASFCPPALPPFLLFFLFTPPPPLPVVSGVSCFPVASAPAPPFSFVFLPLSCCFFSCCASALCVLGCRAVCSLSCPFVVLCASSLLFLVAGVVGSWCRYLL